MVIEKLPTSSLLSRHILEFTIIPEGEELNLEYCVFPQKGVTMALLGNTKNERTADRIIICEGGVANIELLGKYLEPVQLRYEGKIQEIGINFSPLGINYFFDQPYADLAPHHFQEFLQKEWITFNKELFECATIDERLSFLETFLESQYRDKTEVLGPLEKAVALLSCQEEDYSIKQIADAACMTEKTLVRQMKRYAGCTPKQLKRIFRFRHSLDVKKLNESVEKYTHVALESMFYDASHFGREYRLLTGNSPKDFFNKVSFQKDSKYPYLFL